MSMTRLLPPFLFLLLLVPLAALWHWHPPTDRPFEMRPPPWDVPLLAGLALLIWARVQFRQSDSEILTFAEPRNLNTEGVFRYSRNPMYLGFVLILLGAALFVNTWCAFTVPALFFAACNWWYVPAEEENLRRVFGATYEDYAARTRRWM